VVKGTPVFGLSDVVLFSRSLSLHYFGFANSAGVVAIDTVIGWHIEWGRPRSYRQALIKVKFSSPRSIYCVLKQTKCIELNTII